MLKLVQEWGQRENKENDRGVNSTMIYCKKCINVRMYPQYNNNTTIKNKIKTNEKCKVSCLTVKILCIISQGVFYFVAATNISFTTTFTVICFPEVFHSICAFFLSNHHANLFNFSFPSLSLF
jgi:hypothetical protein